jgi:hypothetical protein
MLARRVAQKVIQGTLYGEIAHVDPDDLCAEFLTWYASRQKKRGRKPKSHRDKLSNMNLRFRFYDFLRAKTPLRTEKRKVYRGKLDHVPETYSLDMVPSEQKDSMVFFVSDENNVDPEQIVINKDAADWLRQAVRDICRQYKNGDRDADMFIRAYLDEEDHEKVYHEYGIGQRRFYYRMRDIRMELESALLIEGWTLHG